MQGVITEMENKVLELQVQNIRRIVFGPETKLENGVLAVCREEMVSRLRDPIFTALDVDIANIGDSARIIPVKDVVEPRIKITGDQEYFPGIIGGFEGYGEGVTKVLRGCGVTTAGRIVGFQEGVVDLSGPAAAYTHLSRISHVVITANVPEGTPPARHEEAMRMAGVRGAHYLASRVRDAVPDAVERYELKPAAAGLPRVAVVYLVIGQGLLHDNYLYGVDVKRLHPTLLHPNDIMDGALVSGNCVVAGDKNTTYDHQNSQIIKELYSRHGVDLDFAGVIVTPICPALADKYRCCTGAVSIARMIGADGIIIPEEGSGNPEADLMMICRNAEAAGIRTAMIIGPDGDEECITDTTPEADAVVNIGGGKVRLRLPVMEKVIGDQTQAQYLSANVKDCLHEDGSLTVTIAAITGSKNGLGVTHLTSTLY